MKLIATLLAVTTLTTVALAELGLDCEDLQFQVNPDLPPDCVELAFLPANIAAFNCIYGERDAVKPSPDAVQVAVFVTTEERVLKFLGWTWMSADEANLMHQPLTSAEASL